MLVGAAAVVGLAVGGGLWALTGPRVDERALQSVDNRLSAVKTRTRPRPDRPGEALAQVLSVPLFAATDAAAPPAGAMQLQLFGVARSPGRTAALISVNSAPAQWISLGESIDGLTLRAVTGSGATVATPLGEQQLALGATGSPSGEPAAAIPPAGLRSPPEPASAPSMSQ